MVFVGRYKSGMCWEWLNIVVLDTSLESVNCSNLLAKLAKEPLRLSFYVQKSVNLDTQYRTKVTFIANNLKIMYKSISDLTGRHSY